MMRNCFLASLLFVTVSSCSQIWFGDDHTFLGPVKEVREVIEEGVDQGVGVVGSPPSFSRRMAFSIIKNDKIVYKEERSENKLIIRAFHKRYGLNGKVQEKTIINQDSIVYKKMVYHWKDDFLERLDHFDQRGYLFSSRIYKRDSIRKTSVTFELLGGVKEDYYYEDLNETGKTIKCYDHNKDGEKRLYEELFYDSLGRLAESKYYFRKEYSEHRTYFYDENDRVIGGVFYDTTGQVIGTDSIVYDHYSNIIFKREFKKYKQKWFSKSYEYEYDQYGNYLVMKEYDVEYGHKILFRKVVRKITYE